MHSPHGQSTPNAQHPNFVFLSGDHHPLKSTITGDDVRPAAVVDEELVKAQPAFTLRFTEWRCGHHGTRPADIACATRQQAQQILHAISSAISQPGCARAVLFTKTLGFGNIYITDDYVSPTEMDPSAWGLRSTVYCLSAEQFSLLQTPALATAYEHLFGSAPAPWDGTTYLEDSELITLLSPAEVEAVCRPIDWTEEGTRLAVCDIPPVIQSGDWLLAEVRDTAADMADEGGERPLKIIHLVGEQCSGKTVWAKHQINVLRSQGLTAKLLDSYEFNGLYEGNPARVIEVLGRLDVLFLETNHAPRGAMHPNHQMANDEVKHFPNAESAALLQALARKS